MTWYNELTSDAKENVGNWTKWPHYIHTGDCDPEKDVLIHLDSGNQADTLEDSNRATIERELKEADPDNVSFSYENHWAVGKINSVVITALDDNGDETPAWIKIVELAAALADYPILDESDFSEREWNELTDNVQSELDSNGFGFMSAYDHTLTDDLETGIYPDTDKVIENAREQISNGINDKSAEILTEIIAKYDRDILLESITTEDIEARIEEMDRSDLEQLQAKITKTLKDRFI